MHFTKLLPMCPLLVIAPLGSAQPSFITLGASQGRNTISHATKVSDDGRTVVGWSSPFGGEVPFRWTRNNGFSDIDISIGGSNFTAQALSRSGVYIGGSYNSPTGVLGYVHAFSSGSSNSVPDLPGGSVSTFIGSVDDTSVAFGYSAVGFASNGQSLRRAISWSAETGVELVPLPTTQDESFSSVVTGGLLDDGRVLISANSGRWWYGASTGFERIEEIDGMQFRDVTPDARLIVGAAADPTTLSGEPSYWTADEGIRFLPRLPGSVSGQAVATSADASLIVGVLGVTDVVWIDQGTPITVFDYAQSFGIDMTGWIILSANDVSADGRVIVGTARHASWELFRVEAFVLTIPAPGAIGALCFGIILTARRSR